MYAHTFFFTFLLNFLHPVNLFMAIDLPYISSKMFERVPVSHIFQILQVRMA
jgi:hypothetical protein